MVEDMPLSVPRLSDATKHKDAIGLSMGRVSYVLRSVPVSLGRIRGFWAPTLFGCIELAIGMPVSPNLVRLKLTRSC